MKLLFTIGFTTIISIYPVFSQKPDILFNKVKKTSNYLPDFSYAGYHNSNLPLPDYQTDEIILVTDFGAVADDEKDDSKAIQQAIKAAEEKEGFVTIQFPAGKFILSEILYLERSRMVLRGAGSGESGTTIFCPRPLKYFDDPAYLEELRSYLIELEKVQVEKENNINLPFSQYSWSGGIIWAAVKGERVKSYLERYAQPINELTTVIKGVRGELVIEVNSVKNLNVGDVIQIEWFNKEGKTSSLLKELYGEFDIMVGSHHWNYPDQPLVKQQVRINKINGKKISLDAPLLLDIRKEWNIRITEWKHLEEIGVEHMRIEFPMAPNIAHHVEEGYNAIYFTRVFNGWINDVIIRNADSGILTEESANLTIRNIETSGDKQAHYSVYVGGVHNVLVQQLKVKNVVKHPLSFNTFATKCVYTDCEVLNEPVLDQHSGANHQNLFDDIKVKISLKGAKSYPLFKGGGAGYWKPSHGAFSTFWNIQVDFEDGLQNQSPIELNGMQDGPFARIIGVKANKPVEVNYGPDAYIELVNHQMISIPSLFTHQLKVRKALMD